MPLKKVAEVREDTYTGSESQTRSYKRYHFKVGASKNPASTRRWLSQTEYAELTQVQLTTPVSVGNLSVGRKTLDGIRLRGKTLWWFNDRFYVEPEAGPHPPGHQRENGTTGLVKVAGVHEETARDSFLSLEKRHRFISATSYNAFVTEPWILSTYYPHLRKLQSHHPVSVGTISLGKHQGSSLWWFKDEFYADDQHPPGQQREEGVTGLSQVAPVTPVQDAFDKEVSVRAKWHRFSIGPGFSAPRTVSDLGDKEYRDAKKLQSSEPVSLGKIMWGKHHDSTLWWYKDEFYVEKDGYTSEEVQLLLWETEHKRTRKFERLSKEMLSHRALEDARRERIPDDVRIFVWRRDDGRCVQCGSQQKLEFDHIIPVSKGGSNTARNIQLLCETCNRRKSDST